MGAAAANFSGRAGVLRLFNDLMGGQASWLLPAALLVARAPAWRGGCVRRAPTAPAPRCLLWGSWLVVSGLVFSLSARRHPHLLHGGARAGDRRARRDRRGRAVARRDVARAPGRWLALGVVVTAVWSIVLLERTPWWEPWLRPLIGVRRLAVVGLLAPAVPRRLSGRALDSAVLAAVAVSPGPSRTRRRRSGPRTRGRSRRRVR